MKITWDLLYKRRSSDAVIVQACAVSCIVPWVIWNLQGRKGKDEKESMIPHVVLGKSLHCQMEWQRAFQNAKDYIRNLVYRKKFSLSKLDFGTYLIRRCLRTRLLTSSELLWPKLLQGERKTSMHWNKENRNI